MSNSKLKALLLSTSLVLLGSTSVSAAERVAGDNSSRVDAAYEVLPTSAELSANVSDGDCGCHGGDCGCLDAGCKG